MIENVTIELNMGMSLRSNYKVGLKENENNKCCSTERSLCYLYLALPFMNTSPSMRKVVADIDC